MENGIQFGGYISISSSIAYRYVRYREWSKSFFTRIHPRMDNSARGALLRYYDIYIPPTHQR